MLNTKCKGKEAVLLFKTDKQICYVHRVKLFFYDIQLLFDFLFKMKPFQELNCSINTERFILLDKVVSFHLYGLHV